MNADKVEQDYGMIDVDWVSVFIPSHELAKIAQYNEIIRRIGRHLKQTRHIIFHIGDNFLCLAMIDDECVVLDDPDGWMSFADFLEWAFAQPVIDEVAKDAVSEEG